MPPTNIIMKKENDNNKIITPSSSRDKHARQQSSTSKLSANDDHNIEEEVMDYDDYIIDQENKELFDGNRGLSMSIAYYYQCVIRCPSRSKLLGKQGIVKYVRIFFRLSKRKGMLIKRVLVNVNECKKTKTTYTGNPFFHKKYREGDCHTRR